MRATPDYTSRKDLELTADPQFAHVLLDSFIRDLGYVTTSQGTNGMETVQTHLKPVLDELKALEGRQGLTIEDLEGFYDRVSHLVCVDFSGKVSCDLTDVFGANYQEYVSKVHNNYARIYNLPTVQAAALSAILNDRTVLEKIPPSVRNFVRMKVRKLLLENLRHSAEIYGNANYRQMPESWKVAYLLEVANEHYAGYPGLSDHFSLPEHMATQIYRTRKALFTAVSNLVKANGMTLDQLTEILTSQYSPEPDSQTTDEFARRRSIPGEK